MLQIDLSVIIPVYNAVPLLERCLNSIFTQTTQYSYEVILVDDGSTDNSVEVIKARPERNIVLHQQSNAGPAAARNKGMELAKGRYVTFIDADDYWEDKYIEESVSFLDVHLECVAVTVGCKNISSLGGHVSYNPIWLSEDVVIEPYVIRDFFAEWACDCFVGTCSTTIRREVALQSGGMRTDLRVSEDYEYWNYISTFGRWGLIPKVLYISDGGDVTWSQGWLNKMKCRWANAPALSVWECRIVATFDMEMSDSYKMVQGRVSRNLTYCQLLDGRLALSRSEALKYGEYFIKDPIGKLMNLAKYIPLTWWMLAKFLQYREYHRR
ncbi:MAG: glycosyltransferase family 2 protein [Bacteroides sp.]|jgi:glycosyltransferase involved in cell wall biosynthesis|nr:glycosyltransferase family 2 protein [Bacteroides sp.]